MSIALITGSGGLIGSAAVRFFADKGFAVVGIDNDARSFFFGPEASTAWNVAALQKRYPAYRHHNLDIRDAEGLGKLFGNLGNNIAVVIHTAAQPSHDWAAKEPQTDFSINANGTLNLLEATRAFCPEASFIFTSTNKVYGDRVNFLRCKELDSRFELDDAEPYARHGVDEGMSLDNCTHSLFGVAKAAADLLVQEYGRYFHMNTVVFRGGCLTGPDHSAAQLHGFLGYLLLSAIKGTPYTIFGHKGKQVRDNIHAYDVVNAFWQYHLSPRPGEVYNIGGGRHANISMLEAVDACERLCKKKMNITVNEQHRTGDHRWWISDVRKFQSHYSDWKYTYSMDDILMEMHDMLSHKIKNKMHQ